MRLQAALVSAFNLPEFTWAKFLFAAAERLLSMHLGIKHSPRPDQAVLGILERRSQQQAFRPINRLVQHLDSRLLAIERLIGEEAKGSNTKKEAFDSFLVGQRPVLG